MRINRIIITLVNIVLACFNFVWFGLNITFALNNGQAYKADAEILVPFFWAIVIISAVIFGVVQKTLYKKSQLTVKKYIATQAIYPIISAVLLFIAFMS